MDSSDNAEISEALQAASAVIAATTVIHYENLVGAGATEEFAWLLVKDWHYLTANAIIG